MACVMIDLDYFKRVNDTFGHHAGDRVLKIVAEQLKSHCRASDYICRYGGDSDHLARLWEWHVLGEGDGGDDE